MLHLAEQQPVLAFPAELQARLAKRRARHLARLVDSPTFLTVCVYLTDQELTKLARVSRIFRKKMQTNLILNIRLAEWKALKLRIILDVECSLVQ